MKRKIFLLLISFIFIVVTGCGSESVSDSVKFKREYEQLNGTVNSAGKEYRTLLISEDNPVIYSSAAEIIEKVDNKETFYVYFGSALCPWCRSVIEKAIDVASANNIEKIYYVDIWDEDGNEILRDKYVVDDNGKAKKVNDGTDDYFKLLDCFEDLLSDYTLSDNNGDIKEKRIYAPTFIYVENGQAISLQSGISDRQTDAREELMEKILKDEEEIFNKFFVNRKFSCDMEESC